MAMVSYMPKLPLAVAAVPSLLAAAQYVDLEKEAARALSRD